MNGGGGGGGQRRTHGAPRSGRKDKDEDLLLFREMNKKDKDRIISLLQPVSDEFEANGQHSGNYPLYKMTSAKKGSGYEFLGESGKNDYDWLKTPPATPLFPSLEMEANAPELIVQRELPIIQPLSRFSANTMTAKESSGRSKSPNPKQKALPRSVTPSQRPSVSLLEAKATTKTTKPVSNQVKTNPSTTSTNIHISRRTNVAPKTINYQQQKQAESTQNFLASSLSKSMGPIDPKPKPSSRGVSPPKTINSQQQKQAESPRNFMAANLSKSMGPLDPKPKPSSRGVSPQVIRAVDIPGFSEETPPNLRTDRSASASRGRFGNRSTPAAAAANIVRQKPEPKAIRRQSCSPSVTRGRKQVETKKEGTGIANSTNTETGGTNHENNVHKARAQLSGGNGGQIFGSRMVDKFISARKSSAEERETKSKLRGSINESSGFRRVLVSKSSLDVKRDPAAGAGNFHRVSTTSGRSYATTTIKTTPTS